MTDANEQPPPAGPPPGWTFQLNAPTMICLLYLAAYFTLLTPIVGVVLAYMWRREGASGWENTHYTYLIRTFWMGTIGLAALAAAGFALVVANERAMDGKDDLAFLMLVPAGLLGLLLLVVLTVRCALALVNAQRHCPMPEPKAWVV